jgi:hypothetical protein
LSARAGSVFTVQSVTPDIASEAGLLQATGAIVHCVEV